MSRITLFVIAIVCVKIGESILTELVNEVDLTWPFDNSTIYWKNAKPFVFTKKTAEVAENGYWYSTNEFCAAEHGGTHFDAPYHFSKKGWTVGDVPLTRLIANGITIDLSKETELLKHRTELLPKHLQQWEQTFGPIPYNCVILVKFGWAQYYSNKAEYLGIDKNEDYNFPGVSQEAAEWIVQSGKVVGVGIDTASIDPGIKKNLSVHRILSENQIYVLENVNIPSVFPSKGYILYVMPMKIKEGSGAPLRLIAAPPNKYYNNSSKTPWFGHVIVVISSLLLLLFSMEIFN